MQIATGFCRPVPESTEVLPSGRGGLSPLAGLPVLAGTLRGAFGLHVPTVPRRVAHTALCDAPPRLLSIAKDLCAAPSTRAGPVCEAHVARRTQQVRRRRQQPRGATHQLRLIHHGARPSPLQCPNRPTAAVFCGTLATLLPAIRHESSRAQHVPPTASIADASPCSQPQNEYIELHQKRHGYRLDHFERRCATSPDYLQHPIACPRAQQRRLRRQRSLWTPAWLSRKKEARVVHQRAKYAQKVKGLRAKLFNKKRFQEKADMKKPYAQPPPRCLPRASSLLCLRTILHPATG